MPNWSEEVFIIKKVKNTVPWTYVINDLNGEEIIGTFYEKELQKTNQEEFRIEKVIRRKGNKLYVKWKCYDNSFNSWIDKKDITHVDVTSFASKTNLAALKTEVDKLDTDKLKTTPVDLAKLSNVIENEVVKKTDYNAKVTSIEAQITGLNKNTTDNLNDNFNET